MFYQFRRPLDTGDCDTLRFAIIKANTVIRAVR
jgi:hypothetical protein